MIKNKKGISLMIGYILLVAAVLAMSVIVYSWMKTYIPKEPIECPDGVSIYVKNFDCTTGELTIKNNGRFSVAGFFIKGTESEEQEIAIKDLSEAWGFSDGKLVFTYSSLISDPPVNGLEVNSHQTFGEEIFERFDETIYAMEIIPFRYQEQDGKNMQVICSNAKIREAISGGCPIV